MLLVEVLDAAGSDAADARLRGAALRALRTVVQIAVLGPGGEGPAPDGPGRDPSAGATAWWDAGPAGLAQLRALASEGRFDLILIAAAAAGGGGAARAIADGSAIHWWPTGVAPAPGWSARFRIGRAGRPALPAIAGSDPQTPPGLAWSSVGSRQAGRNRLTLWDGEYLLAPAPLAGDDGSRLLAAFAGLASEWCALDLVVLAEPQPGFEREARARGIGPRVHFVGGAAREAEWAWWMHATGAVLAGAGPISGGLVLRGMKSGCPILALQSDEPGMAIGDWLERNGCAPATRPDSAAAGIAALARMLDRDPAVTRAVAAGRALAAAHAEERLPERLAAALTVLTDSMRLRDDAAA